MEANLISKSVVDTRSDNSYHLQMNDNHYQFLGERVSEP